mgnify:CR=1 FL=1
MMFSSLGKYGICTKIVGKTDAAPIFHQSFPQYSETPLTQLTQMARYLGLGSIFVKDESYRFGLNAFKVLGGSFAMARYIAKEMGRDVSEMTYDYLTSEAFRQEFGHATFFTATDGNHGRAVAWTAQQLGKKAVIYMPKGSDPARLENIRSHGAEASITELNYDDAVRLAWKTACENGWVMVQDTAWDGYEDIPTWIIQGYAGLAVEALAQWRAEELAPPTHLFLQAGVGSFASGVLGYMASELGDALPGAARRRLHLPFGEGRRRLAARGDRRSFDAHGGSGLR